MQTLMSFIFQILCIAPFMQYAKSFSIMWLCDVTSNVPSCLDRIMSIAYCVASCTNVMSRDQSLAQKIVWSCMADFTISYTTPLFQCLPDTLNGLSTLREAIAPFYLRLFRIVSATSFSYAYSDLPYAGSTQSAPADLNPDSPLFPYTSDVEQNVTCICALSACCNIVYMHRQFTSELQQNGAIGVDSKRLAPSYAAIITMSTSTCTLSRIELNCFYPSSVVKSHPKDLSKTCKPMPYYLRHSHKFFPRKPFPPRTMISFSLYI